MKYSYAIIEDNKGALQNLQIALSFYSNLDFKGHASSLQEGISLVLTALPQIVFLDVELNEESGFDLLKTVRQQSAELPLFIMTTDYIQYAKEAVNLDVLYFLDKPIDPDALSIAMKKAEQKIKSLQNHLIIKSSKGYSFIDFNSIQYIGSQNNCCNIYQKGQKELFVTRTLKSIENILPPNFLRIHNQYIINRDLVKALNTTKKELDLMIESANESNLKKLPIGNLYLDKVRNVLLRG